MQTVEEFMESYFSERSALMRAAEARSASFRERCFTPGYLAKRHKDNEKCLVYEKIVPIVVLNIEIKGNSATAIILEPMGKNSERRIYHLRATISGWQIERKGWGCFSCKERDDNDDGCPYCSGKGWTYH